MYFPIISHTRDIIGIIKFTVYMRVPVWKLVNGRNQGRILGLTVFRYKNLVETLWIFPEMEPMAKRIVSFPAGLNFWESFCFHPMKNEIN